jgi:ABC-type lipoprotein export system ATPase subunit
MINKNIVDSKTIAELLNLYPFIEDFLTDHLIDLDDAKDTTLIAHLNLLDPEILEEKAIIPDELVDSFIVYTNQMIDFLGVKEDKGVQSITLKPGFNKYKEAETFEELTINKGEIIAIVGPTGSGKSRLLADIEWGANADTPTNRTVLIDGKVIDIQSRFSSNNKLVAQLSQNMNFVMDLSVEEFVELHAKSRMVENEKEIIEKIFNKANELAGEKFSLDTPITSLSGGQSRALMIADVAILSKSPIVLIDEIENAGIDRKKALDLLVGEEKIVLMATHDPILALMGDKRIIISNGGIDKVMEITVEEKAILHKLESLDDVIQGMRTKLRYGQELEANFEIIKN